MGKYSDNLFRQNRARAGSAVNSHPRVVADHPQKYPKHNTSKGSVWGGICNRTACTSTGAIMFNVATRGYYCRADAHAINYNPREPKLCVPVDHDLAHAEMDTLLEQYEREAASARNIVP